MLSLFKYCKLENSNKLIIEFTEKVYENLFWWISITLLFYISSYLPISIFYKSIICFWFFLFGLEVANKSLSDDLHMRKILIYIKNVNKGLLLQFYLKTFSIGFIVTGLILISLIGDNTIKDKLNSFSGYYVLGLMLLCGMGFHVFSYLHQSILSVKDKKKINYECKLALQKNDTIRNNLYIFLCINVTISLVGLDLVSIFLFPFVCYSICYSYKKCFDLM